MMFHLRVAQTSVLATGSALALMTAALGDHAHAEGKLDASYTISFARIRVGDIAATGFFGESEYAISARGRAGGPPMRLHTRDRDFARRRWQLRCFGPDWSPQMKRSNFRYGQRAM